jgi:tRNA dimethylallyltransferase
MKLPLLIIVGPTAVGKTALSVEVAARLGAEIISGDSMQVYRGMDIGTAKIRPAETRGVPHHLIDILDPDEPFSVAEFQERVDQAIQSIWARGRLPILVGGTGLYVRAVRLAYTFVEGSEADPALRARLAREEEVHGPGYLHRRLAAVDPAAAAKLHPNDTRRIIRALEVWERTGTRISETQTAESAEPRYDDLFIGLNMERDRLYERIDARVDQMMAEGFEAEVAALMRRYPPGPKLLTSMNSLGYRELIHYRRGLSTRDEAVYLIKRNTRRFAKRQLTWFRREPDLRWVEVDPSVGIAPIADQVCALAKAKWGGLFHWE